MAHQPFDPHTTHSNSFHTKAASNTQSLSNTSLPLDRQNKYLCVLNTPNFTGCNIQTKTVWKLETGRRSCSHLSRVRNPSAAPHVVEREANGPQDAEVDLDQNTTVDGGGSLLTADCFTTNSCPQQAEVMTHMRGRKASHFWQIVSRDLPIICTADCR